MDASPDVARNGRRARKRADQSPCRLFFNACEKMCELLAKREGKENAEEYFLAGMFSLINVIMKRDWDDILDTHPIIRLSRAYTKRGTDRNYSDSPTFRSHRALKLAAYRTACRRKRHRQLRT